MTDSTVAATTRGTMRGTTRCTMCDGIEQVATRQKAMRHQKLMSGFALMAGVDGLDLLIMLTKWG